MSTDKERLEHLVDGSIKKVFKDSLSFIEMLDLSSDEFGRVRKMILRSGNDEIRKVHDELKKYDVTYEPRYDDEVRFDERK